MVYTKVSDLASLELVIGNTIGLEVNYQLTDWVYKRDDIQFAVDQLEKDKHRFWQIRKNKNGYLAVFTNHINRHF